MKLNTSHRHDRFTNAVLLAAGTVLTFQAVGLGVPRSWDTSINNGSWNDPNNWISPGVPNNGEDILLKQSDAVDRTVFYVNPSGVALNSLGIDATGPGLMTLSQAQDQLDTGTLVVGISSPVSALGIGAYKLSGGTLLSARTYIGGGGVGTFSQTAGVFSSTAYLSLGEDVTAKGVYSLSGAGLLTAREVSVGYNGTGTFTQTAGSVSVGSFLSLGAFPTAQGSYDMIASSSLTAPMQFVGHGGAGTFNQVAGTNNASIVLSMGELVGSIGTYTIGGNASLVTPELDVGFYGIGAMFQNGGIVNAANFNVGAGTYGGGVAATGTYSMTAGTAVATDLIVSVYRDSAASFTQSGGTTTVSRDLSIAYYLGSRGALTLDGGTLNANSVYVGGNPDSPGGGGSGGTGTLIVNNGAMSVGGTLSIWNRSYVRYNGGGLTAQALDLRNSSRLIVGSGGGRALRTSSLAIAPSSRIDLNDNDMIVDYTGATPFGYVRGKIVSGWNFGNWDGPGINTSIGNTSPIVGLGYAEASDVLGLSGSGTATFSGQTVDATTVLVKFTYLGDANLDGAVDISDLGRLATNWQTSADWSGGDFDYSGFVDISDLGRLATNWQAGVGDPLGPSFDQALASVGLGGVVVPEPGTLGTVVLAAWSLKRPRRRHQSF